MLVRIRYLYNALVYYTRIILNSPQQMHTSNPEDGIYSKIAMLSYYGYGYGYVYGYGYGGFPLKLHSSCLSSAKMQH